MVFECTEEQAKVLIAMLDREAALLKASSEIKTAQDNYDAAQAEFMAARQAKIAEAEQAKIAIDEKLDADIRAINVSYAPIIAEKANALDTARTKIATTGAPIDSTKLAVDIGIVEGKTL